jgi:hypothetical protein
VSTRSFDSPRARGTSQAVKKGLTATEIYALAFGLFLGLAILKFGNPAILDRVIGSPASFSELLNDPWPLHWANPLLAVLAVTGAAVAIANKPRWAGPRWLWVLPLVWFAWQLFSTTQSVDRHLTAVTLCQLGGCVACYFLGAIVVGRVDGWRLVMVGVLAALAFCLVRAVVQKFVEFPRERQLMVESERAGWTNLPPGLVLQMKRENLIISSNGVDIANPLIMQKYEKGRVHGTLVYPNALAGAVLLLLPMGLVAVFDTTRNLRRLTCVVAMALSMFLGATALFASGSKGGWLIALAAGAFWLLRLNWPRRFKWLMVAALLAGGLVVFGVRFQSYFAKGAASVGARFDYWRVAARVTAEKPLLGSGPGTFQRPYGRLKRPEAEMARLVHNDYLEQFSDSGMIGGLAYAAWIVLMLGFVCRRIWRGGSWLEFAVLVGLLAWFVQGLMEFSLYVPALAWTAFTLAGCLLHRSSISGNGRDGALAPSPPA